MSLIGCTDLEVECEIRSLVAMEERDGGLNLKDGSWLSDLLRMICCLNLYT